MPKQLTTADRRHWSQVQAAVLNRFNWPAKRKVDIEFVVRLASQIADHAVEQYRARTRKQP